MIWLTISLQMEILKSIKKIIIIQELLYYATFHQLQEILKELIPFEWGDAPKDGINRLKREILMLENGAKYEGEWIGDSEIRDGRGI